MSRSTVGLRGTWPTLAQALGLVPCALGQTTATNWANFRCNIHFLGVRTTYRDPARKMTFHSLDTNQSLNYFSRPPLSARVPRREFLRLFASESAANTPHTHYNTLMPPHRPVVLTGSSLVAFAKSPAARELSGRPEWAQDTTKTEVSGRNGTSTQLGGTSVGRGAPSWLVVVCGS